MVPAIIGAAGLIQSIGGLVTRSKGKKELAQAEAEYKKNPYTEDVGITDLYNRTLQRASTTGFDTVEGRLGQQQLNRNLLTALKTTQGQRGRSVEGMLQKANQGQANLLGQISAGRRADLGLLSSASQLMAGERMKKYKYNVLDPIGRKYGLSAQKMAEGGAMASAGLRNIISGLSSYESTKNGKKGNGTGDYDTDAGG